MKTVKEISEMTGISVRTLHYYDEIGLLRPTAKSEAGYRLYDDKALEMLQQILFFREFDIPLKEIKAVMENPALEKNQILLMQRKMLASKKERLERLIASIDEILKGEKKMDFEVFGKSDIETLFEHTLEHLPESQRGCHQRVRQCGAVESTLYGEGFTGNHAEGVSETGRMVWEQRGGSRCRYGAAKPGIGSGLPEASGRGFRKTQRKAKEGLPLRFL